MEREEIMKRCKEFDPIWQAMKAGKKFRLWDNDPEDSSFTYLTGIDFSNFSPYITANNCYQKAEPIEPVRRVKDPVSLMKALVVGGYECDIYGNWVNSSSLTFDGDMFRFCGKELSDIENFYEWLPEWTEEVYK